MSDDTTDYLSLGTNANFIAKSLEELAEIKKIRGDRPVSPEQVERWAWMESEAAKMIRTLVTSVESLRRQSSEIREAVREHRDQRGDDRCWRDDDDLYAKVLGNTKVDTSLPPEGEFLESCSRSCKQFWNNRQRPEGKRLEPAEMTIKQLQDEVERLREYEAMYKGLCK